MEQNGTADEHRFTCFYGIERKGKSTGWNFVASCDSKVRKILQLVLWGTEALVIACVKSNVTNGSASA